MRILKIPFAVNKHLKIFIDDNPSPNFLKQDSKYLRNNLFYWNESYWTYTVTIITVKVSQDINNFYIEQSKNIYHLNKKLKNTRK